jgi:hypothetical protein
VICSLLSIHPGEYSFICLLLSIHSGEQQILNNIFLLKSIYFTSFSLDFN